MVDQHALEIVIESQEVKLFDCIIRVRPSAAPLQMVCLNRSPVHITPSASMASATRTKPAILAPRT